MPIDSSRFKDALRHWASGVTIITARSGDEVCGMTVSAFSSVSADPPLVLVCADRSCKTRPAIAAGGVFAVNILARGQEELSTRFATDGNEARRFDGLHCKTGPSGAPWIPGALAVIDCKVASAHEAGDHTIYVGEVLEIEFSAGEPLLYYQASYRSLRPD